MNQNDTTLKIFQDTTVLTNDTYSYRIYVRDTSDNGATSMILSAQPFASPIRKVDIVFGVSKQMISGINKIVIQASTLTDPEITDIRISRSKGNCPMVSIDNLTRSQWNSNITQQVYPYVDHSVLPNVSSTYRYKIQYIYWDGSQSRQSTPVSINFVP